MTIFDGDFVCTQQMQFPTTCDEIQLKILAVWYLWQFSLKSSEKFAKNAKQYSVSNPFKSKKIRFLMMK